MRKILIATFILLVVAIAFMGRGPDRDLNFERVILNRLERAETSRLVFDLKEWPKWHYQVEKAEWLGSEREKAGAKILTHLRIKEWKTNDLVWEVLEWTPPTRFRLKLISDSSQKIFKAFQTVESGVEIQNQVSDSKIRGYATAKTGTFRIRLLSRISERTVMHQVFYPDLNYFQFDLQSVQYHPAFDPPPPHR